MKTISCLRISNVLIAFLIVLGMISNSAAPVSAQTGTIAAAATPSNSTAEIEDTVIVTVNIDMNGVNKPDNHLGNYTAALFVDNLSLPVMGE